MNLLARLYHLLYPDYCLSCKERTEEALLLCAECKKKVSRLSGPACFLCGLPFVSDAATSHSPTHSCGDCRAHPPPFVKAITPYRYEGGGERGPLAAVICQFKYQKQTRLGKPLADLLMNDLAGLPIDRVLAIPLHPARLRVREFNQSLLLARIIAKQLALPYSIDAMIRVRETDPQVGLSKKEREANMKGAFCVIRKNEVEGQRILLIDDVYTTGATLREGTRSLISAGAKEVIVATVARMLADGTGTRSVPSPPSGGRGGGED
jgi:ComF family protein